jgi:hypothetical protein
MVGDAAANAAIAWLSRDSFVPILFLRSKPDYEKLTCDPLQRDSKVSQFDSLLVVKLEVVREGIGERSDVLLEQGELLVDLCVVVGVGVVLLICVIGHRGFPLGFESKIAYAMTHMSHAVQTASSRRGKDSEGFPEFFPRRIGVSRSTNR